MAYKWLTQDWKKFFAALDQAETEEDVKRICEDEIAGWRARGMQESSLRNPMSETRNEIRARLQGDKQEWALTHLAFSEEWYRKHNAPSRANLADRLEHQQLLKDPDAIVNKAVELLSSDRWYDLAVALGVLTGRRPGEVLKTAIFEPKTMYSVLFTGQLKRRGDPLPPYEIPTLCQASAAIDALARLRAMLDTANMVVSDVTRKYSPFVQEAANRHFQELIPARHGKDDTLYGHLFRSVYPRIACFWYAPPTIADMHFMATIQGHTDFFELETEEARQSYGSQAHYADYKIADLTGNIDGRQGVKLGMKGVELLEAFKPKPRKEKATMTTETTDQAQQQEPKQEGRNVPISVDRATFNREQALKTKLGHRTHTETITVLLDTYEQKGDAQVSHAQLTIPDVIRSVLAQDAAYQSFLKEESSAAAADLLDSALTENGFSTFLVDALIKEAKFRAGMSTRHAGKDFSSMTTSQLSKVKHPGATKERIRRAIAAIAAYNDNAPSPNDRWFINATVVQHLSGARFPIIQEYFADHQAEIAQENAEYDLTPRYNHKPVSIKDVITVPEQPSAQPETLGVSAQAE
jgi:hypothetical protein